MRPSLILLSSSTTLSHLPGSRQLELLSNMGDTSEDQKKEGRQRRVLGLSSADNQLPGVSAQSKKIKKQKTDKQKEMKAKQLQEWLDCEFAKELQIEEWENENAELLTSGIRIVYVDGACENNKLFKKARQKGIRLSSAERGAGVATESQPLHPNKLSVQLPAARHWLDGLGVSD
ncbi:hypothetical protein Ddc_14155 [Ditylenchus destructor]|nr:hypothetical protein Ddc_14155 [Ditylenchus destructor]